MKKIFLFLSLIVASHWASGTTMNVNCTTAGQLNSYFTATNLSSLTSLTVSGKIDARDIRYINKFMSFLDTLNLSSATIGAYTGRVYTESELPGDQVFPANEFPASGLKGNASIDELILPANLTSVGDFAFEQSVLSGMITVPLHVTKIGNAAFASCNKLTYVFLPTGLKSIANNAFADCKKIRAFSIPNGVTTIGMYAFSGCSMLETVNLPTSLQELGDGAFSLCPLITGALSLPGNVRYGSGVYNNCTGITSVRFNSPIDTIPEGIMKGCTGLKQVYLPEGIVNIGYEAFAGCTAVSQIAFPESLKWIEQNAFDGCSKLTTLRLPAALQRIGEAAFANCTSVSSVFSKSTTPPTVHNFAFLNINTATCKLYVPVEAIAAYRAANEWKKFTNILSDKETQLIYSYPAPGQTGVSVTPGIQFVFNKKMTVEDGMTISVAGNGANGAILKTLTKANRINTDSTTIYFEPSLSLDPNTVYKLYIRANSFADENRIGFPAADTTYLFTTSHTRGTTTLDFNSSDLNPVSDRYIGAVKQNSLACSVKGGVSYYTYRQMMKHQFEEKSLMVNLYTYFPDCLKEAPAKYSHQFTGFSAKSLLLRNASGYSFDQYSTNKASIDLGKFPANSPVRDIFAKIHTNYIYNSYTQPMTVSLFANGVEIRKISLPQTTSVNAEWETDQSNTTRYYRTIHLPVDGAEKVDSVVFNQNGDSYVEIMQVKLAFDEGGKPVVDLGGDRNFCQVDGALLDAGYTPGATYKWSTGATTQSIRVYSSANYWVEVSNTVGISRDSVKLVAVAKPKAQNNKAVVLKCVGEQVTLHAQDNPNFTYQWSASHSNLFTSTAKSIVVSAPGMYTVTMNNGGCEYTDTVYVENREGARLYVMNQSCCFGYSDLRGELYRKNLQGKYTLYKTSSMPAGAQFDSVQAGEYIFKAHIVSLTMNNNNTPWIDTYHHGKRTWSDAPAIRLNCTTDTTIVFQMDKLREGFVFNGSGTISGTISATTLRSATGGSDCETRVVLYDGSGNVIATTCPDSNGNYSFTNLPAGNYSVGVEMTGYSATSLYAVTLTAGGNVTNASFTIDSSTMSVVKSTQTDIAELGNESVRISVYPVPVRQNATISIVADADSEVDIEITDLTGRRVKSLFVSLQKGNNTLKLDATGLSGIYLLKVSGENVKAIVKFVVK